MAPQRDLTFLLSNQYDPIDDTPSRFRQTYNRLAKYRDDLQKQCNAKEEKPSAAASEVKGTRFSGLVENENGPAISPLATRKLSASLTIAQLDRLTNDERKVEVENLRRDIETLKKEKRERHDAAAAESKQRRIEEAKNVKGQNEVKEDQDVAIESELGQGWETVKRRVRR